MIPDYSKYLRYAAYRDLHSSFMKELENSGVYRFSRSTFLKTLDACYHNCLLDTVTRINVKDSLQDIIDIYNEAANADTYNGFLREALVALFGKLDKLDRKSLVFVEKELKPVMDNIINDLLDI